MPIMPPAPERFSITTGWPSMLDIFSVRMRLMTSDGPPAGNGTMKRIGWLGKSWAIDIPGHSSSVARPNRRTHFDIGTSSLAGPRAGPRHLSLQRFDAATPRAEASRPACQKPMIYAIGCCERMPKPSKALTRTGMFYDPRRNDHNLAHNP